MKNDRFSLIPAFLGKYWSEKYTNNILVTYNGKTVGSHCIRNFKEHSFQGLTINFKNNPL